MTSDIVWIWDVKEVILCLCDTRVEIAKIRKVQQWRSTEVIEYF